MDIHRCRFVPFPPSTISSLAFSHSSLSKNQKTAPPRLALGRANGDIEIWNPLKGTWLQETIIHGGKDRSIDGLVWTQDPNEEVNGRTIIGKSRLFSIGYTTTVTEWDLAKGVPLRQTSGNHGEIWCIAAQPALVPTKDEAATGQWPGQSLVAGCTDGAMVLYSTKDEDLQLQKLMVRPSAKKAKIISVVFQNRNIVIAGCTDSIIRIYDIRNGGLLRNMSLGSGPKGGPKEIIVWSVKVLKDGTIISGDSTGELRIWDGKTYTLKQRIKSHRQDILSLATSQDGSAIFSGGMDRRTVVYKPTGKGKSRWAEVAHRRFHTHDVKTMASFEGDGMSVIVSGGPDASPTVIPLSQFGFENQRALPFLPQEPLLRSSPQKRLLMSFWDREIHIWRLGKLSQPSPEPENEENQEEPLPQSRKLVAKILIKGEANITSATLTTDGSLLAVSTISSIKLFALKPKRPAEGDALKVTKVDTPTSFTSGARLIQFSPNGKWLCIVRPDSHLSLLRIASSESASSPVTIHSHPTKLVRLDRKTDKFVLLGGLGVYDRTITQVTFSSDSKILAVSDLAGYIDTFVLEGKEDVTQDQDIDASPSEETSDDEEEDSEDDEEKEEKRKPRLVYGQHWIRNPNAKSLPKLPSTPVVLSFRPTTSPSTKSKSLTNGNTKSTPAKDTVEDRLLVITGTSSILEFSVLKGNLTPWSRRNPPSTLPQKFLDVRETAKGCLWDVSNSRERIWLYGSNWLWMFDLSKDFPSSSETQGKKRKRGGEKGTGAGNRITDAGKQSIGISRKIKLTTTEDNLTESNLFPDEMDLDEDSESEEDQGKLRRGGESEAEGSGKELVVSGKGKREKGNMYYTFKYRPTMGVVVVGEGEIGGVGPEVALVERPIWEVEEGEGETAKYVGEQEWREKDLSANGF